MKTYEMAYECSNCGTINIVSLPVGTSAPIDPKTKCKYCGCGDFFNPRRPTLDDYKKAGVK